MKELSFLTKTAMRIALPGAGFLAVAAIEALSSKKQKKEDEVAKVQSQSQSQTPAPETATTKEKNKSDPVSADFAKAKSEIIHGTVGGMNASMPADYNSEKNEETEEK